MAILDSSVMPVCPFTRAPRCKRVRGEAGYGQDHLTRRPFYGFRLHARVCWPGVISPIELTPGQGSELARRGLTLLAPFRRRTQDPWPQFSRALSHWRYRIDTIFGQLVERTHLKRIWAHDLWHLTNRLVRKVLIHTLAVCINLLLGRPPLQLTGRLT